MSISKCFTIKTNRSYCNTSGVTAFKLTVKVIRKTQQMSKVTIGYICRIQANRGSSRSKSRKYSKRFRAKSSNIRCDVSFLAYKLAVIRS